MMPIRIQVITVKDLEYGGFESVKDFKLDLPQRIVAVDAIKISYVLQYEENGDAELFQVRNCIVRKAWPLGGRDDRCTLEMSASRSLRSEAVLKLFEKYSPGRDLEEAFVVELDKWLAAGHKASDEASVQQFGFKSMNFEEAKVAVSNYYAVEKEQVKITIVG